tara:strand:+ start:643 stop:1257 length:615 start_codon:yes stop_codon:yes gene_type:complete
MKKHTRDVFSVLEVNTSPPSFDDMISLIQEDRKHLSYDIKWRSIQGPFTRGEHGETSYYDFNLFQEARYKPLMKHIMGHVYKAYREFVPEVNFMGYQAWWTVYEPGALIPRHSHSNSHISGAYYVRHPKGCGSIQFFNPFANVINHFNHPDLIFQTATDIEIEPYEGMLLMFPGWLEHQTSPNASDEEKIIVSFNLVLDEESHG